VTEAVPVGERSVAVGVDSGARVGVAGWQAVVKSRHPSKRSFFMGVF
jgi:hypothetical protein